MKPLEDSSISPHKLVLSSYSFRRKAVMWRRNSGDISTLGRVQIPAFRQEALRLIDFKINAKPIKNMATMTEIVINPNP